MCTRGHGTIDHTADMGICGWGDSIIAAFEETAASMFELMADLDGLGADRDAAVSCGVVVDRLEKTAGGWILTAHARGASRENAAGRLLAEVKAATYCGASVIEKGEGRWEARCVVDL
jgi:SHS2 domain-containing protein